MAADHPATLVLQQQQMKHLHPVQSGLLQSVLDLSLPFYPVITFIRFAVLAKGSEEKTSPSSLAHRAASDRANQSHSDNVTDNDDQVGDRWDEDEDWGSLEVR